MIRTESDPDSFNENVDALDGPNLPHTNRPNVPAYRSPSMEQSAVELMEELQKAIRSGNEQIAMEMAKLLASMHLSVTASLERNSDFKAIEQEISVRMHVCNKDLASTENYITIKLRPTMTFETLKTVMYQKHGYLPDLQKWIVGRRLAHDGETLAERGVDFNGAVVFLYLVTPKDLKKSQGLQICDPLSGSTSLEDLMMQQSPRRHELTVSSTPVLPSVVSTPPVSIPNQTGGNSIQPPTIHAAPVLLSSSPEKVGWACPQCTYINLPTRPGCEMCAAERPATYLVPVEYKTKDHEQLLIHRGTEFRVLAEENYDDVDAIPEYHSY